MFYNEECVEFENQDSHLLRGILHHGNQAEYKKKSLICLNTGLNDMVGWHRLQIKIARFLAGKGYNILRFDDSGIGDSEGELEEGIVVDLFAQVETGLWAYDAVAAVDFMQANYIDHDFVLLGFCGGALTAIHAAANDDRIMGIINIGAPVTVSTTEYLGKKDPWTVKQNVKSYKQKILKWKSVKNFITGKSDYSDVFRSTVHFVRHKFAGRYNQEKIAQGGTVDIKNLNYSFFDSFEKYAKQKKPILFYYAELDNATWGLKKYFLSKYMNKRIWKDTGSEYIEIEKANHIFSGEDTQEIMKQDILNWLEVKQL
jgi:pimeloyl-ACP methyl ester carboxylesterase